MYLWTEYEGATIDRAFALTKLLRTEGRSAFFSTLNANNESVLIRIIECHFDEDEILARWRGVQTLGHPNFLRIDRFGQFFIEDEDITAVYAMFEHVDDNLGEVLERGYLSTPEATEIGLGVASALEALHANGFVHEHVEAGNIYAVGDNVKLRSDCIRETPEGGAGVEARRRDVHDLAVVLTQVLRGSTRGASASRQRLLPPPFDEILANCTNGSWGFAEIKAALGRHDISLSARQKSTASAPSVTKPAPFAEQAASTAAGDFSAKPLRTDHPANFGLQPEPFPLPASKPVYLPGQKPSSMEVPVIFGISEHDFRKWLTVGSLSFGAILIGWIFLHHVSAHRATPAPPVSTQADVASPDSATAPPAANAFVQPIAPKAGSQPRVEWRVVAFTYHRQDQAQKKALSLAQQRPNLSPAIFSPTGRAPWLVTIGGVLQRDAAHALARKARSLGLPRDTYAQNYTIR